MVVYPICRTPARPRYLPQRYARKALDRNGLLPRDPGPEKLGPGQERLYSFYEPPMVAGLHRITTKQSIGVRDDARKLPPLEESQDFVVVAPRYSLPDGAVHSAYPPQGHTDNVEILPHIVLADPQLPWVRRAIDITDPKARNRVPWLAMLVFRQEELRYSKLAEQQSNTLAVALSLGGLGTLVAAKDSDCASPVVRADGSTYDGDSKETEANFIFVPRDLFNSLFRDSEKSPGQQKLCDVSRYQWLSHTRNINTAGMANSGIDGEEGVFSVVIAQRAGPLDVTEPTDLVAHLVSIEHVSDMSYPVTKDRIALCSLESWSYTSLPPNSFNVYDAFRHLGSTHDVLRITPEQIERSLAPGQSLPDRLRRRLLDGFVMTDYRTQVGERTAAWMRGPLVPRIISHGDEAPISHTGQDLQVMDRETGIMDITYGVAWQLGKALALADQGYTTALSRLSVTISRASMEETKKSILRARGAFRDKEEILGGLAESLRTLRSLHNPEGLRHGPDARWLPSSFVSVDVSRKGHHVRQGFSEQVALVTERLTGSTSDGFVYNELNTPLSPDWMIVCSWILDRMYLAGVPAHYYLPDPSYLPDESLRFFHIDRRWIDALVDGALSIGSHLPNDEEIRGNLKKAINKYLTQKPDGLHYPPQRPGYGFLLRSELCVKFPDLIVEGYARGKDVPDPTIILRQENIAEGVLLVMFDKKPGSDGLSSIVLREPPHEQAFACGASLKPASLAVAYKKIYTIPLEQQPTGLDRTKPVDTITHYPDGSDDHGGHSPPIFTWSEDGVDVRSLHLPAYARRVHEVIRKGLEKDYTESEATATLMGIQLNHPMWYLQVRMEPSLFGGADSIGEDDDGLLDSLKMTGPPMSPPPELASSQPDASNAFSYSAPVDWNAPFVERIEGAQGSRSDGRDEFRLPPPHVRCLAVTSSAVLPTAGNVSLKAGPERMTMAYSIYPLVHREMTDKLKPLPHRQDAIFSVRRKKGNDRWMLSRITISFPHGKPRENRATLMEYYDGPGASMVTDFRFNVVPSLSTEDNDRVFRLTILPRADYMLIKDLKNLSIMLSGIMVSDYSKWRDEWGKPAVKVDIREEFVERNDLMGSMDLDILK
ncbi:hypothetical protein SAMD00023353_1002030 [Rosellinia necatrix]|uniref:Uncharacterized protein n=1 Tax=Rosellinia necatrix TaxID=77044 RepID=A0A1W2TBM8_ROSNE|nr:hypothetical protein SAMD00023353_1002030 [Rosellinia necatrix]